MGGTIERSGDAGEALPDAQGGSGTLSERQDVLTDLMERKMNVQKAAPEKDQEKIPKSRRSWSGRGQKKRWSSYKGNTS